MAVADHDLMGAMESKLVARGSVTWWLVTSGGAPWGAHLPVPRLRFGRGWCSWQVVNAVTAETRWRGDHLRVRRARSTLIGSGAEPMRIEAWFNDLMLTVPPRFRLDGDHLVMTVGAEELRFEARAVTPASSDSDQSETGSVGPPAPA